jgi:hypothetical protein
MLPVCREYMRRPSARTVRYGKPLELIGYFTALIGIGKAESDPTVIVSTIHTNLSYQFVPEHDKAAISALA